MPPLRVEARRNPADEWRQIGPLMNSGEAYLMEHGSKQNDLWGVNLHLKDYGTDDFIEFDSMINIRPSQGNASKDVLDPVVRQ